MQYFWDPLPKNEDESPIWCLGRSYDSRYRSPRQIEHAPSPSAKSESEASQADSGIEAVNPRREETADNGSDALSKSHADLSKAEEEASELPQRRQYQSMHKMRPRARKGQGKTKKRRRTLMLKWKWT